MPTLIKNASVILPGKIIEGQILTENGKIKKISENDLFCENVIDLKGCYVAPGFIDTHIHGYNGFGTDGEDADALLRMSSDLAEIGDAAFCPTLYACERETLIKKLKKYSRVIGSETGAEIIGLHLEGPFLVRPGAMNLKDLAPITKDFLTEIHDAAEGKIAAITAAPELENFELLAAFCAKNKIVLQAGHTNATYEQMLSAKKLGVNHITHLFNEGPMHHREPGAAGAGLTENFYSEVIADNVHLHKKILSLIAKVKRPQDIVLVTDGLTPTGQKNGPYYANGTKVEAKNGAWRKIETGAMVGSMITMLDAVKNFTAAGATLENAVLAASTNPARLHGLTNLGKIEEGCEARLVAFDKKFNLKPLKLKD